MEKSKQFTPEEKEKLAKEEGVTPEFQEAVKKGIIPDFEKDRDEVMEIADEILPEKSKPWDRDWPKILKEKIAGGSKILKELHETENNLHQQIKELSVQYDMLVKNHSELISSEFNENLDNLTNIKEDLLDQYNDPKIQSNEKEKIEILDKIIKVLELRISRYQEEIDRIKNQLKKR